MKPGNPMSPPVPFSHTLTTSRHKSQVTFFNTTTDHRKNFHTVFKTHRITMNSCDPKPMPLIITEHGLAAGQDPGQRIAQYFLPELGLPLSLVVKMCPCVSA